MACSQRSKQRLFGCASCHVSALRELLAFPQTLHQPGGYGSSILSPAGGLQAAGLSFVGLSDLVSVCSFTGLV